MENIITIFAGIMSFFVVIYRIIYLMIPMINNSIKTENIYTFFKALTLLI